MLLWSFPEKSKATHVPHVVVVAEPWESTIHSEAPGVGQWRSITSAHRRLLKGGYGSDTHVDLSALYSASSRVLDCHETSEIGTSRSPMSVMPAVLRLRSHRLLIFCLSAQTYVEGQKRHYLDVKLLIPSAHGNCFCQRLL